MKTKYILAGGYVRKAPDGGRAFCEELVKEFGFAGAGPVKLLDCTFARAHEDWEPTLAEDKEFFAAHLPGRTLDIRLADPKTFLEQLAWADCVYLRGGDTRLLKESLLFFGKTGLEKAFEGKTIAGSSAGTAVLSVADYDLDYSAVDEGFGFVPVKTLCHYRSDYNAPNVDWDKIDREIEAFDRQVAGLPVVKLREGEFMVFGD